MIGMGGKRVCERESPDLAVAVAAHPFGEEGRVGTGRAPAREIGIKGQQPLRPVGSIAFEKDGAADPPRHFSLRTMRSDREVTTVEACALRPDDEVAIAALAHRSREQKAIAAAFKNTLAVDRHRTFSTVLR